MARGAETPSHGQGPSASALGGLTLLLTPAGLRTANAACSELLFLSVNSPLSVLIRR